MLQTADAAVIQATDYLVVLTLVCGLSFCYSAAADAVEMDLEKVGIVVETTVVCGLSFFSFSVAEMIVAAAANHNVSKGCSRELPAASFCLS